MHLDRNHDCEEAARKDTSDVVPHDGVAGIRADIAQSTVTSKVIRPNFLQMHLQNLQRFREARGSPEEALNSPEKERRRRDARDRMRTYHGKTAATVRPYVRLDGLTPEEKKERKRIQDREARRRYNAKLHVTVSLESDKELEALLAELGPSACASMSAEEKRESRRLQQIRYRAKKAVQGQGELVEAYKTNEEAP